MTYKQLPEYEIVKDDLTINHRKTDIKMVIKKEEMIIKKEEMIYDKYEILLKDDLTNSHKKTDIEMVVKKEEMFYDNISDNFKNQIKIDKSDDSVKAYIKNDLKYNWEDKIEKIEIDEVEIKFDLNFT